ncbi:Putative collagen-binding domain of a collagenase [Alteromonadaceae bacterium Bs31]|nr:Putative collagen-binding domain of a collagenase [Alteromonadaceae bacterium Bs31]
MLRQTLLVVVSCSIFFLASCENQDSKQGPAPLAETKPTLKQKTRTDSWQSIQVASNPHFFQHTKGQPFFWLGDTGWLLFSKLDRAEAEYYLENRRKKGFNTIQVMVLHTVEASNFQGDHALANGDLSKPKISPGSKPSDPTQYDYWDHVDYIIDLAAKKGLWMAMVPIWGSPVKEGKVSVEQATRYSRFLVERYNNKPNIIWLNGGDTFGNEHTEVWQAIGETLAANNPNKHLITFHPRGRQMSGEWFHQQAWLDFNMFQSGHRHYHQDIAPESYRFGPDNWRYAALDYQRKPVKPTLDGEPSYEEIPHGLHNPDLPRWQARDLRRYAYWSVFAGGAGFTYGHNSVMQFYRGGDDERAFHARSEWQPALDAPGAGQMQYLKKLMLDYDYFSRIPDQSLVLNNGEKFEWLAACRGRDYAMVYNYTGREIKMQLGKVSGQRILARWYNPRSGKYTAIGRFNNKGQRTFTPPAGSAESKDWVLVIQSA